MRTGPGEKELGEDEMDRGPRLSVRGGGAAKKVGLELSQCDSCEWHPGPSLVWVCKTSRLQSSLA